MRIASAHAGRDLAMGYDVSTLDLSRSRPPRGLPRPASSWFPGFGRYGLKAILCSSPAKRSEVGSPLGIVGTWPIVGNTSFLGLRVQPGRPSWSRLTRDTINFTQLLSHLPCRTSTLPQRYTLTLSLTSSTRSCRARRPNTPTFISFITNSAPNMQRFVPIVHGVTAVFAIIELGLTAYRKCHLPSTTRHAER